MAAARNRHTPPGKRRLPTPAQASGRLLGADKRRGAGSGPWTDVPEFVALG
jgi:hypothetical protein